MLSSSLGGNAKTAVVVTISPASRNAFETKSTLDFASRAKKVVNRAVQNEIADKSALLDQYKSEIEELRRRLARSVNVEEASHPKAPLERDGFGLSRRDCALNSQGWVRAIGVCGVS